MWWIELNECRNVPKKLKIFPKFLILPTLVSFLALFRKLLKKFVNIYFPWATSLYYQKFKSISIFNAWHTEALIKSETLHFSYVSLSRIKIWLHSHGQIVANVSKKYLHSDHYSKYYSTPINDFECKFFR